MVGGFCWLWHACPFSQSSPAHAPCTLTCRLPLPTLLFLGAQDRQCMGISSRALDRQTAVYILTLGVAPDHRNRGVAMQLLNMVHQQAMALG